MHEDPSPDVAQLGTTRWLAAVALAVSAIALIVTVAMAWTLTPLQRKNVEQAKVRDAQAKALPTNHPEASRQDDRGGSVNEHAVRSAPEPAAHVPPR
jgi:hypothetical protein